MALLDSKLLNGQIAELLRFARSALTKLYDLPCDLLCTRVVAIN